MRPPAGRPPRLSPVIATLLLAALPATAQQTARDPTALPPSLRSAMAAAAASAPAGANAADTAIRQVVFVQGRGYVVQRGRRYGVGELLDGARIERVTEQAVWLREGGQLRREPLYGGVEKRPPAAKTSKEKQP
ncbi:hypothetical protein [Pelomonas cellulosilytica]|uniref:MSHA biogenesis protein MshK n=1 Tax=Pelomonas cellulosilytica TaxID=2906762 RepID=A0ABS8XT32_9BURK|nr:hypothetical protein [Pelomonas sp. P8]MCE4555874.1 hypothetical protein [Pelomonas sp. P8]